MPDSSDDQKSLPEVLLTEEEPVFPTPPPVAEEE